MPCRCSEKVGLSMLCRKNFDLGKSKADRLIVKLSRNLCMFMDVISIIIELRKCSLYICKGQYLILCQNHACRKTDIFPDGKKETTLILSVNWFKKMDRSYILFLYWIIFQQVFNINKLTFQHYFV
jgi:hypothetical protein